MPFSFFGLRKSASDPSPPKVVPQKYPIDAQLYVKPSSFASPTDHLWVTILEARQSKNGKWQYKVLYKNARNLAYGGILIDRNDNEWFEEKDFDGYHAQAQEQPKMGGETGRAQGRRVVNKAELKGSIDTGVKMSSEEKANLRYDAVGKSEVE